MKFSLIVNKCNLLFMLLIFTSCSKEINNTYNDKYSYYEKTVDHSTEGHKSLNKGNIEEAISHLKKSADSGNRYDMFQLGNLYLERKEYNNSFKYIKESVILSTDSSNQEAKNKLAYLYYNGLGTEKNYKEAIYYYNKSIKIDDSIIMLAEMNEFGIGTKVNLVKAYYLYKLLYYKGYYEYKAKVENINKYLSNYSKKIAESEFEYYKRTLDLN